MSEYRALEDLRPAPRSTPTVVLWAMLLVITVGSVALIWWPEPPGSEPIAAGAQRGAGHPVAAAESAASAPRVQ